MFLSSPADIVIYGGSAGGGKTWALLIDPLRHIHVRNFGGTIFRRTYPEITNQGGLWDESLEIYPHAGGVGSSGDLVWRFPYGSKIDFSHIQYDDDLSKYLGAQICYIGFDQLETFTRKQFFFMLQRNRSLCGVKPYIRATCNPDADSWLAEFIDWWIAEDGYADMSRAGVIRWFVRVDDEVIWGNTREELEDKYPPDENGFQTYIPLSVTFIPATVYNNRKLMERDPTYLAKLMATDHIDRERLLGDPERGGNWKIRAEAGKVFNRAWFEIVDDVPDGGVECRFFDLAATERNLANDDPDYTASVKIRKVKELFYILDATEDRIAAGEVREFMANLIYQDYTLTQATRYMANWETEPGSAAIRESLDIARELRAKIPRLECGGEPARGPKLTRWKPLAAAANNQKVKLQRGPWNEKLLTHLHGLPDIPHDDLGDAAGGAYRRIEKSLETNNSDQAGKQKNSSTYQALQKRSRRR